MTVLLPAQMLVETDLFLCVFGGPTLYVFDKILVEVSGEGGGEGAGGPGR